MKNYIGSQQHFEDGINADHEYEMLQNKEYDEREEPDTREQEYPKTDYKRIFRFKIGKLTTVELSYSRLRPMQLKMYYKGVDYWNLFFGKFLLSYNKAPF